jgi:phosphoribosylformimino-5-aminoimidazole carboxamide ribotide isomerase
VLKRYNAGMAPVKPGLRDSIDDGFVVFPAIDLRDGRVVRLRQGDFARETVYGDDPVAVALTFAEAGAAWIHVVDLDGARSGVQEQSTVIDRIIGALGDRVRVQLSGGLRDETAVAAVLDRGVQRAVIGTSALREPALVGRLVREHGAARIAVALDVRDGLAVGEGWHAGAAGVPIADAATRITQEGATTLIVTAIARDGLLEGPDLGLLRTLVRSTPAGIVASGGIGSNADLLATRTVGCRGAIVGRALYEGSIDLRVTLAALRAQ